MAVSVHNTNKINHTVCFALCQLALPHDVTGGDVSDVIRRQKREIANKGQARKAKAGWGRGGSFWQEQQPHSSAGQLFLNNTQQQQDTVGTTVR
jgi:hypothetical protein